MLQLDGIDWHAPWLVPLRAVGQAVQQRVLVGCLVADALNSVGACPVGFVRQAELPPGQAYEQYIFDTARSPPAKTCTISSTAWCGCSFRTPSAA